MCNSCFDWVGFIVAWLATLCCWKLLRLSVCVESHLPRVRSLRIYDSLRAIIAFREACDPPFWLIWWRLECLIGVCVSWLVWIARLITIPHVRSLRTVGSLRARIVNWDWDRVLGLLLLWDCGFLVEMPYFGGSVVMPALWVLIYVFRSACSAFGPLKSLQPSITLEWLRVWRHRRDGCLCARVVSSLVFGTIPCEGGEHFHAKPRQSKARELH